MTIHGDKVDIFTSFTYTNKGRILFITLNGKVGSGRVPTALLAKHKDESLRVAKKDLIVDLIDNHQGSNCYRNLGYLQDHAGDGRKIQFYAMLMSPNIDLVPLLLELRWKEIENLM